MSTPTISSLDYASRQVTIYLGIPILITGIIGGIFNIIVFLSLKTFRESSCAFYLTVMSFVNIGHLLTGLLSRIMISGFDIDWTRLSLAYCKFRPYCLQSCILISFTCMCLATIDQFLATCSKPHWQRWNNIKIAHRLIIICSIFWLLHTIPYGIYFNQIQSPTTSQTICTTTNAIFRLYNYSVLLVVLYGVLPVSINTLFGLLAYRNVRDIAYRTIPLVRRELDKQLTIIVLIQAVYNFLASIPYLISNILTLNTLLTTNTVNSDILQFTNILTLCIFYLNFSSPFYMYICASGRFRQQFIHVFYKIHFNRCRRTLIAVNQIAPH